MRLLKAYIRSFVVTLGISLGGLFICIAIAMVVGNLDGFESKAGQIVLIVLIAPALLSVLLGIGLGESAFQKALEDLRPVDTGLGEASIPKAPSTQATKVSETYTANLEGGNS